MGPINDVITSWQLRMLIIGQSDKIYKSPITNHISNFNTSQGASETQYNSLNMELILQNPDTSGRLQASVIMAASNIGLLTF
jgi:hypothetical protein